jgi:hypothetical protein
MNDDPGEQAAGSAHCAADARHQGEKGPQADLIVHATHSTTHRRKPQWRPGRLEAPRRLRGLEELPGIEGQVESKRWKNVR